jgi:chemotaxis protein methyltransferase WspC
MKPDGMVRIEALLTERTGLDPATIGSSLIPRAVRLRMSELKVGNVADYAALVSGSETELQALIEEVVIPESWFFRDEMPFHLMQDQVRRFWIADNPRSILRVLSIPCAGGEEPYSIVIALLEAGLAAQRFHIDAIDISARRIDLARRGIFSKNSFRGNNPELRSLYFSEHAEGYELDPTIRSQVQFSTGSVLDPVPLANKPCYDFIFCRNLLIYLNAPSREHVIATLERLLAANGLLIIGHADRLDSQVGEPRFVSVGERGAFTYRRANVRSVSLNSSVSSRPIQSQTVPTHPPDRPAGEAFAHSPLDLKHRRDADLRTSIGIPGVSSIPVVSPIDIHQRNRIASAPLTTGSLLDQARGEANLGRYEQAIALCEQYLQLHGPSAAVFYLLGVIQMAAGHRQRAEQSLNKAVYLDPSHDEALLALALTVERRGDISAAAGLRRRAEQAVRRKGVQ